MICILLALDKIHYSRAPQFLSQNRERPPPVLPPATVEVDHGRRESPSANADLGMPALYYIASRESGTRMSSEDKLERTLSAPE